MARYAVIADLAAQASWEMLAGAAGKDDLLVGDDADEVIDGAALRAAANSETPPADGTALAGAIARLERALDDACALVDSYLLRRYPSYEQPARGSESPTPVTVWTVDLALERLLGRGEGDEWNLRGQNVRSQLKALAAGDIELPGDIDGDGEDDHVDGEILFEAPAATFSRSSLSGFVGR